MTRYLAFLRGVNPMNCKMPELKQCFEAAGFAEVKTLLSSGNVAFSADPVVVPVLEQAAEKAMERRLGQVFRCIVRPSAHLQALVERDVFGSFELPAGAKRAITFLREPHAVSMQSPVTLGESSVLKLERSEAFSVYVPGAKGSAFLALLERRLGKEITTRTLETVKRCAAA